MSEVAGRLAAQAGAYSSRSRRAAAASSSAACPESCPAKVVVLGGGIVGYNAALVALGMKADVWMLERSVERMRDLEEMLVGPDYAAMSTQLEIEQSIADADVVIGAVLIPGARAPKLITREMLGRDEAAARCIVDVAIDQGGCTETSRPTTHSDPVYVVDGVTHYCVANMPGAVPVTSTKALTNVTLPYVEAIATAGFAAAVAPTPRSRGASTCWREASPTRRSPRRTACVHAARRRSCRSSAASRLARAAPAASGVFGAARSARPST